MCTLPPSWLSKSAWKPAACFCYVWHYESSDSGAHGVVVPHPLRVRKALGSVPSVSMHSMLHVSWLENDFFRPPAPSTDSVSAVLFVGLVSCLSVPLSAQGPGGQYTLENAGRDDLGGFSTPILPRCFWSKKSSKSSRPRFLNVGLVWPLLGCVPCLLPGWASQPENQQHVLVCLTLWEQWLRGTWCSGITSPSHAEGRPWAQSPVCPCTACCMFAGRKKISFVLLPPPQTAFQLCCLSAFILLVRTAVCTGPWRKYTLENGGGMI